MVDFSVIIPVWNTPEELVRTCIESLKSNRCDYELLLIDDGSGGEYADFLDSLESDRVRVLHKEHGGISRARNYGLLHARGKYVTHADSDDFLAPGILDRVLRELEGGKADLVIGMIARTPEAHTEVPGCEGAENTVLPEAPGSEDEENAVLPEAPGPGDEENAVPPEAAGAEDPPATSITEENYPPLRRELRIYYTDMQSPLFKRSGMWVNRAPHAKFMTRELALKTPYREEIPYCEDVIWNFDLLNHAESVTVLPVLAYYYIDVPFSNTQKYRPDSPSEIRILMKHYHREIAGWPKEDRGQFEVIAITYFSMLMRVYVFFGEKETRHVRYREIVSDPFWRRIFRRVELQKLSGNALIAGRLGKKGAWRLLYLVYEAKYLAAVYARDQTVL